MTTYLNYNTLPGFLGRPMFAQHRQPVTTNVVAVNVKEVEKLQKTSLGKTYLIKSAAKIWGTPSI